MRMLTKNGKKSISFYLKISQKTEKCLGMIVPCLWLQLGWLVSEGCRKWAQRFSPPWVLWSWRDGTNCFKRRMSGFMRRMLCIRTIISDHGKILKTTGLDELLEFYCELTNLGESKFLKIRHCFKRVCDTAYRMF